MDETYSKWLRIQYLVSKVSCIEDEILNPLERVWKTRQLERSARLLWSRYSNIVWC